MTSADKKEEHLAVEKEPGMAPLWGAWKVSRLDAPAVVSMGALMVASTVARWVLSRDDATVVLLGNRMAAQWEHQRVVQMAVWSVA